MKRVGPVVFSFSSQERKSGVPFCFQLSKVPLIMDRVEDCYNFAILCNDTYGLFRKMIEEVVDPEALRAIEESEKEEYAQRLFAAPENAMMAAIALRGLMQTRQD